ncbi:MAG: GNAT family N-acetyltransferase [Bacteroidetes bacterium MED-G13]|nr:MAG: GNAT family N-acetyltransferase [Bacteroidetes bacterium MED-G13]|tara:strand:- start:2605 stop:3105 length:501 start_codon:yes stop_codon:yes gene_type:complete
MIRLAERSDLKRVLQITRLCAREMDSRKVFQWNQHYPDQQSFVNDINKNELYVYCIKGKVVGCVSICSYMDKVYSKVTWKTSGENSIYIHRLAVDPKHQQQGIGGKLMDFAENKSKLDGIESIRLDTFSQNKVNQNFYEQRGYVKLDDIYFPLQSGHPFHCYELLF